MHHLIAIFCVLLLVCDNVAAQDHSYAVSEKNIQSLLFSK